MKTILVFVSSLDGKITKWGDSNVKLWTSREDQDYYKNIWRDSPLIVLGSTTYETDPRLPAPGQRIFVMTRNPGKHTNAAIPGQLEFTKESPLELSSRFQKEGTEQMIVAGGPRIATLFLNAGLIDELWLTIEPIILGTGGNFANDAQLDIKLQLIQCDKVNETGTLITKYSVLRK